jgi:hypothetical protein
MGFKGCFSDVHRELSKLLSNVYTQLDGRYRLFGGQSAVASRIKSRCHRISCGKHERNKAGTFSSVPIISCKRRRDALAMKTLNALSRNGEQSLGFGKLL